MFAALMQARDNDQDIHLITILCLGVFVLAPDFIGVIHFFRFFYDIKSKDTLGQ